MDKFHSRRQSLLGRNLDNTIHRINHYVKDQWKQAPDNTRRVISDLYSPFEINHWSKFEFGLDKWLSS